MDEPEVTIGARVVFVDLPTVMRDLGRGGSKTPCAAYTLDEDALGEALEHIPGFARCEGLQINGLYPCVFDDTCEMSDAHLIHAVKARLVTVPKRGPGYYG